jgi:hypothetical protein
MIHCVLAAQTKTVFRHVLPLLRMIASTSFAARSPPPTLPVLELLRTVLMCAVEVLFPSTEPSSDAY